VLHRDPATQRGDAVDIAVADRFGMVEEPVDAGQRNIAVDLFIDIERAADRLVIGRVQAPGPAMLGQRRITGSRSLSMLGGMSGRSTRKSSKSAAE
jgi:hypothetical protein